MKNENVYSQPGKRPKEKLKSKQVSDCRKDPPPKYAMLSKGMELMTIKHNHASSKQDDCHIDTSNFVIVDYVKTSS